MTLRSLNTYSLIIIIASLFISSVVSKLSIIVHVQTCATFPFFAAGVAGRQRAEQHATRRPRRRLLQPRAQGGQPNLHGAAEEAVYEKHFWFPPRPHPEGRDNPTFA